MQLERSDANEKAVGALRCKMMVSRLPWKCVCSQSIIKVDTQGDPRGCLSIVPRTAESPIQDLPIYPQTAMRQKLCRMCWLADYDRLELVLVSCSRCEMLSQD